MSEQPDKTTKMRTVTHRSLLGLRRCSQLSEHNGQNPCKSFIDCKLDLDLNYILFRLDHYTGQILERQLVENFQIT